MTADLKDVWNIRANLYAQGLKPRALRVKLYATTGRLTKESLQIRAECEAFFDIGDKIWNDAVRALHSKDKMTWTLHKGFVDCQVAGLTYRGGAAPRTPVWKAVNLSDAETMDRLAIFIQFFEGLHTWREVSLELDALEAAAKASAEAAKIDPFEADLAAYACSC
jgi:hypothetical protein